MGKQTTKTNHPTLISSNNPFHTTSIENHLVFFLKKASKNYFCWKKSMQSRISHSRSHSQNFERKTL